MFRTLLVGGARSGKSALAEQLAQDSGRKVVVIVTADATAADPEMQARIGRHQAERPSDWRTLEINQSLSLGAAIASECVPGAMVIVDCLTVWLANQLFPPAMAWADDASYALPDTWSDARDGLLAAIRGAQGELILVSNEVGLGIVPLGAGNRAFVDEAGWLNQAVARLSERVGFVAAGLPLALKGAF